MPIRVLLEASTTMARSALRAALGECDDIQIVKDEDARSGVDVVVIQQALMRELPEPLRRMERAGRLGVVAIAADGSNGTLYRIRQSDWQFSANASGGLADAIRAAARAC